MIYLVRSQGGKWWTSLIQTKMSRPNVNVGEGSGIHLMIGRGKVYSFLGSNSVFICVDRHLHVGLTGDALGLPPTRGIAGESLAVLQNKILNIAARGPTFWGG
jgi:hypothetical protein